MNNSKNARDKTASGHKQLRASSPPALSPTDSSFGLRPPNYLQPSDFPGVAFSPTPRKPPPSSFKRLISRAIRKLKHYLDKKAAKYSTQQQSATPSRTGQRGPQTGKRTAHFSNKVTMGQKPARRPTESPKVQPIRSSSGAQPLRRNVATTSLDAKGPFSASQKRTLSKKLTTIRESSVEKQGDPPNSSLARHLSTSSYNDIDAASDPVHNGPTTPIPEPAEPNEHFPNLTCRRCKVDWARADELAMDDSVLLRNTEAMRAVSQEAASALRAEMGWIRRRDSFDNSAWREGSIRHAISALVDAKRWHRHRRTISGQSAPSLSFSQSTPGSVVESFPTPANAILSLDESRSLESRHVFAATAAKENSPKTTPVITVSVWDEETSPYNDTHSGVSRTTSARAELAANLPASPNYLRPLAPIARLRGRQPWYLREFTPPTNSMTLPVIASLSVPSQPVDFSMERPFDAQESQQPLIFT